MKLCICLVTSLFPHKHDQSQRTATIFGKIRRMMSPEGDLRVQSVVEESQSVIAVREYADPASPGLTDITVV